MTIQNQAFYFVRFISWRFVWLDSFKVVGFILRSFFVSFSLFYSSINFHAIVCACSFFFHKSSSSTSTSSSSSTSQEANPRKRGTRHHDQSREDEQNDRVVNERMPMCVGICVLLAIVYVLSRTGADNMMPVPGDNHGNVRTPMNTGTAANKQ